MSATAAPEAARDDAPAVGATLVHPQHGTTTVVGYETRDVRGTEVHYLVLERPVDSLVVRIPSQQVDESGLRPIIDEAGVEDLFDVLDDEAAAKQGSWRKRHARNRRRIHSGDPAETAQALRDLHARYGEGGLSTTDLRLYRQARERLTDEIVAATGSDRETVEAEIATALGDVVQPSGESA